MIMAGIFTAVLMLGLVIGDWVWFTSLSGLSSRYGCTVARQRSRLPADSFDRIPQSFGRDGILHLKHGVARLFPEEQRILLRPQYEFFSLRFRTAWPLKGSIAFEPDGEVTTLICHKLVPWSSAFLTLAWFIVVGAGTLAFVATFAAEGGFASLSGTLMGLGVTGLGLLVLAFGLIVVVLAYRLEDHRLSQAYQELIAVLSGEDPPRRNRIGQPWAAPAEPSPDLR